MDVFSNEYFSIAENYLVPLTGLPPDKNRRAYFFWRDYSIFNNQLILVYDYEDRDKLEYFLKVEVFPVLDKNGYHIETYDIEKRIILVLDMSIWTFDINFCLSGKYSKLSGEAKKLIERFHEVRPGEVKVYILVSLKPNQAMRSFENKTAIEYVSKTYDISLQLLQEVGELGPKYVKMYETLMTEVTEKEKV